MSGHDYTRAATLAGLGSFSLCVLHACWGTWQPGGHTRHPLVDPAAHQRRRVHGRCTPLQAACHPPPTACESTPISHRRKARRALPLSPRRKEALLDANTVRPAVRTRTHCALAKTSPRAVGTAARRRVHLHLYRPCAVVQCTCRVAAAATNYSSTLTPDRACGDGPLAQALP